MIDHSRLSTAKLSSTSLDCSCVVMGRYTNTKIFQQLWDRQYGMHNYEDDDGEGASCKTMEDFEQSY